MTKLQLIGMQIDEFERMFKETSPKITVRDARLIPASIIGKSTDKDEMILTSVFLSAVRLIKEFRKDIFNNLDKFGTTGNYFYTEVTFTEDDNVRPDGLILQVDSKKRIKDAMIVEVKNKSNPIDEDQMKTYIEIATKIGAERVLSISNQYVPHPSVVPYSAKKAKGVKLFHLSWSYILTIANVLLYENEHNIEDDDQKALMKEIVYFFESKNSGICGFTSMKNGWKKVSETLKKGGSIRKTDDYVVEAIHSWQQEEMDMALILSRKLGLFVQNKKVESDVKNRFDVIFKELSDEKKISTQLSIKNIVSHIKFVADFSSNAISFSVTVKSDESKKTIKGKVGVIAKQLDGCKEKKPDVFEELIKDIAIRPLVKNRPKDKDDFSIDELENIINKHNGNKITGFEIYYRKILTKNDFEGPKKIIEIIESMLINFYSGIVQYLKNPIESAPQIEDMSKQGNELNR